jgi:hypothetical protein
MSKIKAFGGCLGSFLLGSLGVGIIGWIIMAIFPKSTTTVSSVGGILILILLWNSIDTMIKNIKQKGDTSSPTEVKPTDTESQG